MRMNNSTITPVVNDTSNNSTPIIDAYDWEKIDLKDTCDKCGHKIIPEIPEYIHVFFNLEALRIREINKSLERME